MGTVQTPSSPADPPATPPLWRRALRLVRHRWAEGSARAAFPPALLERLTQAVVASERLHTGQIRICIEPGLPMSYVWRGASARERALTQFGKLRVWDTEANNGVLIYLLFAEHAIEIVADRGLASRVGASAWQSMVAAMADTFRRGNYEQGLTQVLADVTALLVAHFPANALGGDGAPPHGNELPDEAVLAGRHAAR